MKLLAISLFAWRGPEAEPVTLGTAADLADFGYFQRSSVREMLQFTSRTIAQRTAAGQRQTVRQEDYFCHVHVRDSGLAAVAVCDKDYPPTAAFSVAAKARTGGGGEGQGAARRRNRRRRRHVRLL
jgi:synaptobrevin homolog YKT6